MIRRRAHLFADRHHRATNGEAHDIFEGEHPAVDDRQAGGDAACLDGLTVVAAEAGAARVVQSETTTTDREMAAFGPQRTADVVAVILQTRIVGFAHVRIPMTGATNGFRSYQTRHGEYGRPRTLGGRRLNLRLGSSCAAFDRRRDTESIRSRQGFR